MVVPDMEAVPNGNRRFDERLSISLDCDEHGSRREYVNYSVGHGRLTWTGHGRRFRSPHKVSPGPTVESDQGSRQKRGWENFKSLPKSIQPFTVCSQTPLIIPGVITVRDRPRR